MPEHLASKRPGDGIHPDETKYVVGHILKRNIEMDEQIEWKDLE
jgi:sialic acid synthase SpsE